MIKTTNLTVLGRLAPILFLSLFFTLVSCGDNDPEETPEEEPPIEDPAEPGDDLLRYVGEWNGNLGFVGTPISAIVEEVSENNFKGDFFISASYVSCCGSGDSDGEITYQVDGTSLKNFKWVDIIPGCTGTFIGSGTVKSNGDLEIEITGTDCDGSHIATLTLEKQ